MQAPLPEYTPDALYAAAYVQGPPLGNSLAQRLSANDPQRPLWWTSLIPPNVQTGFGVYTLQPAMGEAFAKVLGTRVAAAFQQSRWDAAVSEGIQDHRRRRRKREEDSFDPRKVGQVTNDVALKEMEALTTLKKLRDQIGVDNSLALGGPLGRPGVKEKNDNTDPVAASIPNATKLADSGASSVDDYNDNEYGGERFVPPLPGKNMEIRTDLDTGQDQLFFDATEDNLPDGANAMAPPRDTRELRESNRYAHGATPVYAPDKTRRVSNTFRVDERGRQTPAVEIVEHGKLLRDNYLPKDVYVDDEGINRAKPRARMPPLKRPGEEPPSWFQKLTGYKPEEAARAAVQMGAVGAATAGATSLLGPQAGQLAMVYAMQAAANQAAGQNALAPLNSAAQQQLAMAQLQAQHQLNLQKANDYNTLRLDHDRTKQVEQAHTKGELERIKLAEDGATKEFQRFMAQENPTEAGLAALGDYITKHYGIPGHAFLGGLMGTAGRLQTNFSEFVDNYRAAQGAPPPAAPAKQPPVPSGGGTQYTLDNQTGGKPTPDGPTIAETAADAAAVVAGAGGLYIFNRLLNPLGNALRLR